jgi:type IV pilus assembly protein PilV
MNHATKQGGFAMIEVLVTMLIMAFGLLGYVGLQARTTLSQIEAYQRSQALLLVNDMAQRMTLNRKNAAAYVGNDIGTTAQTDCASKATLALRDLCEWSLLIQGASEVDSTNKKLGAITGAQACITSPAANTYLITLTWQGVQATGAPKAICGKDGYSSENTRRTVNTVVQIADLAA